MSRHTQVINSARKKSIANLQYAQTRTFFPKEALRLSEDDSATLSGHLNGTMLDDVAVLLPLSTGSDRFRVAEGDCELLLARLLSRRRLLRIFLAPEI